MALTPSNMITLGTTRPRFELPSPKDNRNFSDQELYKSKGLLVMFICNHCPFVIHIESGLKQFGLDYQDSEIGIVAISSNDVDNYPQDGPEKMAEKEYPFPYLYDERQAVAKAFDAACTPDFFLFDGNHSLVYRGQFCDSRPNNDIPVSGNDLRNAMDALLTGKDIDSRQLASIGCNIKWK